MVLFCLYYFVEALIKALKKPMQISVSQNFSLSMMNIKKILHTFPTISLRIFTHFTICYTLFRIFNFIFRRSSHAIYYNQ